MRNIFEEDEFEYDGLREKNTKRWMSIYMEDAMNREAGKVAPDTTGADKYFIDRNKACTFYNSKNMIF